MEVVSLNIKNRPYVRSSKVRRCMRRAFDMRADVYGFQEVGNSKRYRRILEEVFHRGTGYRIVYFPVGLVIVYRVAMFGGDVKTGFVKAHGGRRRVTPMRGFGYLQSTYDWAGRPITVWVGHAISGGWSKGWRPTTKWRRAQWYDYMQTLERHVLRWLRDGQQVIGMIDSNRSRFAFLGRKAGHWTVDYTPNPNQRGSDPTHGKRQYDYVTAIGHEVKVVDRRTVIVGGFTDHRAVNARVSVDRRAQHD